MSFVNIFTKPPGTTVKLQTANPSATLMTYVVFVQGHTRAGKRPIATWHSGDLEATGRMLILDDIRGYDFILRGIVTGNATMDATVSFDGAAEPVDTLTVTATDGRAFERRWSIVVR